MMIRTLCTAACLLLAAGLAMGQDKGKAKEPEPEAKEVSGMSIVGNNETPKSLTIIPWKSSEIGQQTEFRSNLLDSRLEPLNRDVFLRELDFYNLSNPQ